MWKMAARIADQQHSESGALVRLLFAQPVRSVAIALTCALALIPAIAVMRGGDATATSPETFARSLFAAGDYARAADALRAAYRVQPSDALRVELAQALLATGDYMGVLDLLTEAARKVDDAGSDLDVAVLRAEAMVQLGRYDDARSVAEEIGATHPGRGALLAARAHYALGSYAQADEAVAAALRAGGEALAETWLLRARMALDAGETQRARSATARAAEAGGGADARLRRAIAALRIEALAREGRFSDARSALAQWSAARPRAARHIDPQTEYVAAYLDAAQGRYAQAAQRLRPLESWVQREPHGALILAYVRFGSGDSAQAERYLRQAARAAPADWIAQDALVEYLFARGKFDEIDGPLSRLESIEPGRGAARRLALLRARGDYDGALNLLRAAPAVTKPPAAIALFGRHSAAAASAYSRPDRAPDEALLAAGASLRADASAARLAAQSLASYTEDALALALAGDLYLAAGEDDAAGARFDAALARIPDFAAVFEGRVRVDVRSDNLRAARERLERRLKERPADAGLRLMLARVLRGLGDPGRAASVLREDAGLALRPEAALVYAHLLQQTSPDELKVLAAEMRRVSPNAPATVEILSLAGLDEEAAQAARQALIGAPDDALRAGVYAETMRRVGRQHEGAAFLEALLRARPDSEGARRALAALNDDEELSTAEPAAAGAEIARGVWLANPRNAAAGYRYGTYLAAAGADEQAARILREARYWQAAVEPGPPALRETL